MSSDGGVGGKAEDASLRKLFMTLLMLPLLLLFEWTWAVDEDPCLWSLWKTWGVDSEDEDDDEEEDGVSDLDIPSVTARGEQLLTDPLLAGVTPSKEFEGHEMDVDLVRISLHIWMQFSWLSSWGSALTRSMRDLLTVIGIPEQGSPISTLMTCPADRSSTENDDGRVKSTVANSGEVTVTTGCLNWCPVRKEVLSVVVGQLLVGGDEPKEWKAFICWVRPKRPPSATATMTQITSVMIQHQFGDTM